MSDLDFSIFDTESAGTAGATLHLVHPTTGEELYVDGDKKKKPVTITIESIDGDTFTKAKEKKLKELQRRQKEEEKKKRMYGKNYIAPDEDIDIFAERTNTAETLARMTKGWTHIKLPGEKEFTEFNFDNAVKLYLHGKEIRDQLSTFAADKANFIKD